MLGFSIVVTFLCSIIAATVLVVGQLAAKSAPQEASVAALALAIAVIPYVFTRCLQMSADRANLKALQRMVDLLETQERRATAAASKAVGRAE